MSRTIVERKAARSGDDHIVIIDCSRIVAGMRQLIARGNIQVLGLRSSRNRSGAGFEVAALLAMRGAHDFIRLNN